MTANLTSARPPAALKIRWGNPHGRCACGCATPVRKRLYLYTGGRTVTKHPRYAPGHAPRRFVDAAPIWERLRAYKAKSGLTWGELKALVNHPANAKGYPPLERPRMLQRRAEAVLAALDALESAGEVLPLALAPPGASRRLSSAPILAYGVGPLARAMATRHGGTPAAHERMLYRVRQRGSIGIGGADKVATALGTHPRCLWGPAWDAGFSKERDS